MNGQESSPVHRHGTGTCSAQTRTDKGQDGVGYLKNYRQPFKPFSVHHAPMNRNRKGKRMNSNAGLMSTPKSAMIVDDNDLIRDVLCCILKHQGFDEVWEVDNGADAENLYHRCHPLVTIMDIEMPVMNGIEAARQITSFDLDAKIILCSSTGEYAKTGQISDAKVKEFLLKPFTMEQVTESITRLLAREE